MSTDDHTTSAIQPVPFYDDTLLTLVDERTGKEYVLPKPMAEMFGLDWSGQLKKMKRNQIFSKGMALMSIPSVGGEQETVLLERHLIHAWLLSISVSKVHEAYRNKLLRYQEECARVLDDYFSKGHANNPRLDTSGDLLVHMAQRYRDQEKRLALVEARERARERALIAAQQKIIESFLMAERAETKADVALEDAHRMTVEDYVLKNGLTRQYRPSEYKRIANWLRDWCQQYAIDVPKAPVVGKPWDGENAYPLQAFAAFGRYEQKRPKQITLVHEPPREPEEDGA